MQAYSAGISPLEFWSITPHEVYLVCKAHQQNLDRFHELAAWHLSYILNMVAKKGQRITPAKLLGKRNNIQYTDLKSFRAHATRKWAESDVE